MARASLAGLVGLLVAASTLLSAPSNAGAQSSAEQELADRHAPVLMLKSQDGPCDDLGEPYAPMSVDLVLDNSLVVLRQVGPQDPVLLQGPGASDIFGLSESVFLDFPGSALKPGCVFEADFRRFSEGEPAVVYAHIVTQPDRPELLALQYWFFWYYNDWNNKHEGGWEGVQLLFEANSVEEALDRDPISVGYAQHEGGELASWTDDKLQREGQRPFVYPSAGSHASYFGEALYLGRSGSEGFGCDNSVGPSTRVDPDVVVLPDSVDDPRDPLAWLAFEGRWGERQSGPFNGPTGPALKGRWTAPIDWHEDLRSRSVIVPSAEGPAQDLILAFCDTVEFGSAQLITLKENPLALLVGVLAVSTGITFLLGRTDWSPVAPLPIVHRRRAGQLTRASFGLFRQHLGSWLAIGLVYFPISLIGAAFLELTRLVPFVDAVFDADADVGFAGAVLAIVIGVAGHLLGLTIVAAGVAHGLEQLESNGRVSATQAYNSLRRCGWDLARAFLRVLLTVTLLFVSIIGVPWGIRRAIGFTFLAPVVMLEERTGRDALTRSSQLVSGRVVHTAAVVVLLNALVAAAAVFIGLLLLVVLAGAPLWLFTLLVTASSALTTPFVGLATTLLYGDARAEHEGADVIDTSELQTV